MRRNRGRWWCGPAEAGRGAPTLVVAALVGAVLGVFSSGCSRPTNDGATSPGGNSKRDALFLAKAPAVVPEELEGDLAAMGIGRLYLAAATVDDAGRLTVLPPPPAPLKGELWFVIAGREGDPVPLPSIEAAEGWADLLAVPLAEMRRTGRLAGIHLHLPCDPSQAEALALLASTLKKKTRLPVSATIVPGPDPAKWKPLSGSVVEVLALAMGRRPETADRMVTELDEERAKAIPVPYRLLVVPGSYGLAGSHGLAGGPSARGRRILDGEVDRLSEDRNLDFDFGQVLSSEPGSLFDFKPRAGAGPKSTSLAADGGTARFQVLSIHEIGRFLASSGTWTGARSAGRVFLVDALPRDGHLLGFDALRALLMGRSLQPKLEIVPAGVHVQKGSVEFSLKVSNAVPLPTELSRLGNWIRIRVDGGTLTSVAPADFDRYELLAGPEEGARVAPFGKAIVCKLFENIFVPGESNDAGPIRVAGGRPRVFVSYHLVQTDGRTVETPEAELPLVEAPAAAPSAGKKPAR